MDGIFAPTFPMEGLHQMVEKMPLVVPRPTKKCTAYALNLLSAMGLFITLQAYVWPFHLMVN